MPLPARKPPNSARPVQNRNPSAGRSAPHALPNFSAASQISGYDVHKDGQFSAKIALCFTCGASFVPNRSPMSIHFYSLTWRKGEFDWLCSLN